MTVVLDAEVALAITNQDREVDKVGRVAWVRIGRPLQEADATLVGVVSTVVGVLDKCLAHEVGREKGGPTRAAMVEGGLQYCTQIGFRRHVADGVVNENAVESSAQTKRANVALEVLALGVERAAHCEHVRGDVNQSHMKSRLKVRGVVPTTRSQLQEAAGGGIDRLFQHAFEERSLLAILRGRREGRPPHGELAVKLPHDPIVSCPRSGDPMSRRR